MSEPVVYKLKYPVKHGSQPVEELTFRPLKFKDLKGVDLRGDPMGATLKMASKLCGIPEVIIGELEGDDIVEVSRIVTDFLPAPKDGSSPSQE